MQEKNIWLGLIVVAAILIGVSLTVYQVNSPLMQRLVNQQTQTLDLLKKLEQRLTITPVGGNVEARLSSVEEKLDSILKMARGGGAPDAQMPPQEDFSKVYTIDVGSSPVKGKKDAPVTIVEFADLECPFCARFHPAVEDALKAYPDKVNYILKNFPLPFHKDARPAAKAAFAAGEQGKYYDMIHLILSNNSDLSEAKFQEFAKQLGLDVKKFMEDYKNKDADWEKRIDADFNLGTTVDVRGTPTYYINGRKTMARDTDSIKKEIDAILANQGK